MCEKLKDHKLHVSKNNKLSFLPGSLAIIILVPGTGILHHKPVLFGLGGALLLISHQVLQPRLYLTTCSGGGGDLCIQSTLWIHSWYLHVYTIGHYFCLTLLITSARSALLCAIPLTIAFLSAFFTYTRRM